MIRLRTIPSMKLKYPIGITHGNTPTQAEKKTGDKRAAALRPISAAAMKNKTAGVHQYFSRKGERGGGPHITAPGGIVRDPHCMKELGVGIEVAIGVEIGLGTLLL
jgi:hypothetical protein